MVVFVSNKALCWIARKEGEKEHHDTYTDQEFSQALKMTAGMVVNTAVVIFFIHAQPRAWYGTGGLVDEVFSMLLCFVFLMPVAAYMDFGGRIKGFWQRRRLTQEKLNAINTNLAKGPPQSKEERDER